ncbi:uncharacterized protein LOC119672297 [Teleopsis dalmanni]|uniref:uncharacterized protein LOC119672263 n=1 Tax=Teleopsis dalmanni TaxID=139649 RepID=UPI0018CFA206|nr:uncharacterized protein LOC119672263 [Teleopsis dalmanni]XP_037939245.1 uncharacterized protein LOC119672297 [Teleopsis dalmanni]
MDTKLFYFCSKVPKVMLISMGLQRKPDTAFDKCLRGLNFLFKNWVGYLVCIFSILLSIFYFYMEMQVNQRMLMLQEVNNNLSRTPKKRRLGAIYRQHEVVRHVIQNVNQHIRNRETQVRIIAYSTDVDNTTRSP